MIQNEPVVICVHCKSFWIIPIDKCGVCGHKSFSVTHESNRKLARNYEVTAGTSPAANSLIEPPAPVYVSWDEAYFKFTFGRTDHSLPTFFDWAQKQGYKLVKP